MDRCDRYSFHKTFSTTQFLKHIFPVKFRRRFCANFFTDPSRRVYLHNRDNHTVNHFIDTRHRSRPFSHKTKSISFVISWRDHCECDQNTNENCRRRKREEQKRKCESRFYWCLRLPMLIDSVAPKCTIKLFEKERILFLIHLFYATHVRRALASCSRV